MLGAIEGLEAAIARGLHLTNSIELVSDSMYTLNMAADRCIPNTNHDLINRLQTLFKAAKATTRWVRGHSGEIINVQCDKLAKAARDALSPAKPIKKRRSKRQRQEQSRKRMLTKEYKANELVGI
jgi:ribonuclease HI